MTSKLITFALVLAFTGLALYALYQPQDNQLQILIEKNLSKLNLQSDLKDIEKIILGFTKTQLPEYLQSSCKAGTLYPPEELIMSFVVDFAQDEHRFWIFFRLIFQFFDVIPDGSVTFFEVRKRLEQLTDGLEVQSQFLAMFDAQKQNYLRFDMDSNGGIEIETEGKQAVEFLRQSLLRELHINEHHDDNQTTSTNTTSNYTSYNTTTYNNTYNNTNYTQILPSDFQKIDKFYTSSCLQVTHDDMEEMAIVVIKNFLGIVYVDQTLFTHLFQFVFDWYDVDQDGLINGCDVLQYTRHVSKILQIPLRPRYIKEQRDVVFEIQDHIDQNQDGLVSWNEDVLPIIPHLRQWFKVALVEKSQRMARHHQQHHQGGPGNQFHVEKEDVFNYYE